MKNSKLSLTINEWKEFKLLKIKYNLATNRFLKRDISLRLKDLRLKAISFLNMDLIEAINFIISQEEKIDNEILRMYKRAS